MKVGLRAIGEAAVRAQDTVETIATFPTEDLEREVEREIVGMLAWHTDVPDPDLGLHRARTIDHDHPARRRRDLRSAGGRHVGACPVAERALGAGEGFLRGHVTDDRQDGVVRHEPALVERLRSARVIALSDSGVPPSGFP